MTKDNDLTTCNNSEEWNEDDHPRDEKGLFVEKTSDLAALLGPEYNGYKGQAAVDKLLKERKGHVKAAFHRDDIGDIALLWGDDTLGLQHILKRREEQNIDLNEFFQDIALVIEKGALEKINSRGNFEIWRNGKMAVIAPEIHGVRLVYVLTAYKQTRKNYKAP